MCKISTELKEVQAATRQALTEAGVAMGSTKSLATVMHKSKRSECSPETKWTRSKSHGDLQTGRITKAPSTGDSEVASTSSQ